MLFSESLHRRRRWRAAQHAWVCAHGILCCGGCETLLGSPFDVDRAPVEAPDGGSFDASVPFEAGLDAMPERASLDDCTPELPAANGVVYPRTSTGALVLNDAMIDTSPDAGSGCSPLDVKHCVIAGTSIQVGRLNVWGSRPLVLIAAHDIVIDGTVNASGGDGPSEDYRGPGDHTLAAAPSVSGGGGNAEEGGRSACGAMGGPLVRVRQGLVGGGDGFSGTTCGRGGRGGGAVQFTSLCGSVEINKFVVANGGSGLGGAEGGSTSCPDGAGGGAGGTVWIQAAQDLRFGAGGTVELMGGGGGGGSCRTATGTWVAGTSTGWHDGAVNDGPPDPRIGGKGAKCEDGSEGGAGGVGGSDQGPSAGGAAPPRTGAGQSTATCGGGGGSRGRLVLDGDLTCDAAMGRVRGLCIRALDD